MKISKNYHFWLKLTVIYFFIQITVRSLLISKNSPGLIDSLDILLDGFLWDVWAWMVISMPLFLISIFSPRSWHDSFLKTKLDLSLTVVFAIVFSMIGVCEIVFWNEFSSRFNFIAVDYLIYTNEVLANLKESYPMGLILFSVLAFSLLLAFLSRFIPVTERADSPFLNKKSTLTLYGLVLPTVFAMGVVPWLEWHDENFHEDQLSRNGVIEFVRAFRSNKIDYPSFYATISKHSAHATLESKKVPFSPPSVELSVERPNVFMIVIESFGAKFIAPLGGFTDTTPYLNKRADESLFFKNFYATGTRTVRGLEALTLSVPPTPCYAVVKRPNNKGLYSMGHTFLQNGYDPIFFYGGRGFFDNMNAFFSGNDFRVVDQGDFKKSETTFSNAWGVCDEDLFNKAIQVINQRERQDQPFLAFALTTSNHRPFTYPEGKIDIPVGSRAGAVKYTDFSIGKFLEKASKEPWAANTLFVIVADHSTEGRGQFDLEMSDFHIPLWIYSPTMIKPQVMEQLGSQIDLLPSLIHLLGLKDDSPFFGKSLFNPNWKEERAFVGNYQFVGYYRDHILTTLGPNRVVRNYSYDPKKKKQKRIENSGFENEAISYYQEASRMLDLGEYKVQE